jgi:hypothetical protein
MRKQWIYEIFLALIAFSVVGYGLYIVLRPEPQPVVDMDYLMLNFTADVTTCSNLDAEYDLTLFSRLELIVWNDRVNMVNNCDFQLPPFDLQGFDANFSALAQGVVALTAINEEEIILVDDTTRGNDTLTEVRDNLLLEGYKFCEFILDNPDDFEDITCTLNEEDGRRWAIGDHAYISYITSLNTRFGRE